jgi:hypothetical protein
VKSVFIVAIIGAAVLAAASDSKAKRTDELSSITVSEPVSLQNWGCDSVGDMAEVKECREECARTHRRKSNECKNAFRTCKNKCDRNNGYRECIGQCDAEMKQCYAAFRGEKEQCKKDCVNNHSGCRFH